MSSLFDGERLFGHCEVEWQIKHFPLQLRKRKGRIQSPQFTISGSEKTNWCMYLWSELRKKYRSVMFTLKRSETDPGPECIRLELKIYGGCFKERPFHYEDNVCFKKGVKYEICLGTTTEVDHLEDLFVIVCNMIVYDNTTRREHSTCSDIGLKLLSKDMLDLYRSARNFDTKLFFGSDVILAHRAILSARDGYLGRMIDKYENNDDLDECMILDFTGILNYNGMKKILAYLYTGDIEHTLEEPSFSIYDCAVILGLEEIKMHYKPDKLVLKSTIDFLEYNFTLSGYKFEDSEMIYNYSIQKNCIKTLQLHFYPKKYNTDYIPLFSNTFNKPMNAYLEFKFFDKDGHSLPIKDELIDIFEAIKRCDHKMNISNDAFEVVIRLKLTTGEKIKYIDKQKAVFVSYINRDEYYKCMAFDLHQLYVRKTFSDTIITNNGFDFFVHRCILTFRSDFFSDMLKQADEEVEFDFSDIERRILHVLLNYIYSGSFLVLTDNDTLDVYEAAVYTNLPQLKLMCSDQLIQSFKINRDIRCRVVSIAKEYDDDALLKSALKYLFEGKDISIMPNSVINFEDAFTCRHCQ